MDRKVDIVSVGDSILDTFLALNTTNELCHYEKEHNELCLQSGAKIMVDSAAFLLGGNAGNVAVGSSRLGLQSALVAELGDDEFAAKMMKGLQEEKIELSHVIQTPGTPSTFSVILNVANERTLFVRHVKRQHNLSLDGLSASWVYLTSMGTEWHDMYQKVLAFVKATGAHLAFNPGSPQIREGGESFVNVLAATDILFVNREEAEVVLYKKEKPDGEKETEENMLFRIQRAGPKIVVMTDGPKGAYAMDGEAHLFFGKIASGDVVEKTGAGDSFASGFLAAHILGKSIPEALNWGSVNSASVIGKVGAQPGLLTREEIEKRVAML